MSVLSFLLVLLSQCCTVAGQLFFKHAMGTEGTPTATVVRRMAAGIACKALDFFLWLSLLSKFDLSYLFPFSGLNQLMLVGGAAIFLREKVSPVTWLGVTCIAVGIALVSVS